MMGGVRTVAEFMLTGLNRSRTIFSSGGSLTAAIFPGVLAVGDVYGEVDEFDPRSCISLRCRQSSLCTRVSTVRDSSDRGYC